MSAGGRLYTFVFTDIEGSTRLLRELGDAFADVLREHDTIIAAASEEHGGEVFGSEGDAQFLVFEDAAAAIAAATAAQRALAAHAWPADRPVRVRMGIHTGAARRDPSGFVGLALHETARVSAAAHGGQVLLSPGAAELVRSQLPAGTGLRDLGEHRLKDIDEPVRLWQLTLEGLAGDFPPLRARAVDQTHLPSQLTTFIAREELDEVVRLLEDARLITLTGPGGTGKTRLAVAAAERAAARFADGTWFVGLDAVTEPKLVASEILAQLGMASGGAPPLEQLVAELRERHALLLLDNLEQVIAAGPDIARLVRECPQVSVLGTSRIPLRVAGEQEFPVPALPLPSPSATARADEVRSSAAVRLFEDRARAVKPAFAVDDANAADVADIVTRLDGLPLAIELAAARVRLLPPAALARRLHESLRALGDLGADRPGRQRTLQGAIAWSHDLLSEPDRRLFARLGAVAGSAAIDQIEAIAGPADELGTDVLDGLGSLVEQSLLRLVEAGDDEPRFSMLGAIREFAREQLEASDEVERIHRRHALAYLSLAEEAAPHLMGDAGARWNDRLEREHDDMRASLDWIVARDEGELGLRFIVALWRFWQVRGHLFEAEERAQAVLAMPSAGAQDPALRSRAEAAAGGIAYWRSNWRGTRDHYLAALELARQAGDRALIAESLYNAGFTPVDASGTWHERVAQGAGYFQEALELFRAADDLAGIAKASWSLAIAAAAQDDVETARRLSHESLEAARAVGDRYQTGWSLHTLGLAEMAMGEIDSAIGHIRESLEGWVGSGDISGIGLLLLDASVVAKARGREACHWRLLGAEQRIREQTGADLGQTANEFPSLEPRRVPETDDERAWLEEGRSLSTDAAVDLAREVALGG